MSDSLAISPPARVVRPSVRSTPRRSVATISSLTPDERSQMRYLYQHEREELLRGISSSINRFFERDFLGWHNANWSRTTIQKLQQKLGTSADGVFKQEDMLALFAYEKKQGIPVGTYLSTSILTHLGLTLDDHISESTRRIQSFHAQFARIADHLTNIRSARGDVTDPMVYMMDLGMQVLSRDETPQEMFKRLYDDVKHDAAKVVTEIEQYIQYADLTLAQKKHLDQMIVQLRRLHRSDIGMINPIQMQLNYYKNLPDYAKYAAYGLKGEVVGVYKTLEGIVTSTLDLTKFIFKYGWSFLSGNESYRQSIHAQCRALWEGLKGLDAEKVLQAIRQTIDHIASLPPEKQAEAIGKFGGMVIGFLLTMKVINQATAAMLLGRASIAAGTATGLEQVGVHTLRIGLFVLDGPAEALIGKTLAGAIKKTYHTLQGTSSATLKLKELNNTIALLESEARKTRSPTKRRKLEEGIEALDQERKKLDTGTKITPVTKKQNVASEQTLLQHATLTDEERIKQSAKILGLDTLSETQQSALLRAHYYPQGSNVAKGKALLMKGEDGKQVFTREQAQMLMDQGLAGKYALNPRQLGMRMEYMGNTLIDYDTDISIFGASYIESLTATQRRSLGAIYREFYGALREAHTLLYGPTSPETKIKKLEKVMQKGKAMLDIMGPKAYRDNINNIFTELEHQIQLLREANPDTLRILANPQASATLASLHSATSLDEILNIVTRSKSILGQSHSLDIIDYIQECQEGVRTGRFTIPYPEFDPLGVVDLVKQEMRHLEQKFISIRDVLQKTDQYRSIILTDGNNHVMDQYDIVTDQNIAFLQSELHPFSLDNLGYYITVIKHAGPPTPFRISLAELIGRYLIPSGRDAGHPRIDVITHDNTIIPLTYPSEGQQHHFVDSIRRDISRLLEQSPKTVLSKLDFDEYFPVEGRIKQGNIGTCYLVAAIDAMRRSSSFEAIVRMAVKKTRDGWEVRVPMDPTGQWIHISQNDFQKWENPNIGNNIPYTNTRDTREYIGGLSGAEGYQAIELAYIKKKFGSIDGQTIIDAEGGYAFEVFETLYGHYNRFRSVSLYGHSVKKGLTQLPTQSKQYILQVLQNYDPHVYLMTCSGIRTENLRQLPLGELMRLFGTKAAGEFKKLINNFRKPNQKELLDNATWELQQIQRHAYTIQGFDPISQKITVSNPWDTARPFVLNLDSFTYTFGNIDMAEINHSKILLDLFTP